MEDARLGLAYALAGTWERFSRCTFGVFNFATGMLGGSVLIKYSTYLDWNEWTSRMVEAESTHENINLSASLIFHQTELELSAQDQALEPPSTLYESMIPLIDPYVPATMRKVPDTMTKTLHPTMRCQPSVLFSVLQLS